MKALLRYLGLTSPDDASAAGGQSGMRDTVIGPGVSVKGEIRGEGSLAILGHFEGEVVVDGRVDVGAAARVDANITAAEIVIAGSVRGNLAAEGRVDIVGSGSLTGTLKSGSLAAGGGAVVKGEVWVEPPAPRPGPVAP